MKIRIIYCFIILTANFFFSSNFVYSSERYVEPEPYPDEVIIGHECPETNLIGFIKVNLKSRFLDYEVIIPFEYEAVGEFTHNFFHNKLVAPVKKNGK